MLLDILPKIVLKILILKIWKFSYIEVRFTDQNTRMLEIQDKINITLVINWSVKYEI